MKKKNLLTTLTVGICAMACGGLFTVLPNDITAKAAETETQTEAVFAMQKGAAVRKNAKSTGIRFSTDINQQWYTEILSEYSEYSNVQIQLRTLLARYAALSDVNEDGVTDENDLTVAMLAADPNNVGADEAMGYLDEGTITFASTKAAETYTYRAVMTFGAANCSEATYAMEVAARSYAVVTYTENGEQKTSEPIYATSQNNVRAMRTVANVAILYGESNVENLSHYVTVGTRTTEQKYYQTSDDTSKTVTLNNLSAGEYTGYLNADEINVTVTESGEISLSDVDVSALTLGETYYVSVFTADNKVYSAPFTYVTKVIDEASDMSVFQISTSNLKVEGYYVMVKDIDGATIANSLSGSSTNANYRESADVGFDGTFDGQGHTLNITVTNPYYGVFGNLLANAEVKNVAMNITLNGDAGYVQVAFGYTSRKAKLTNAYVKVNQAVTPTKYNTGLIKSRTLNMTNVIVDMTSVTYNAELSGSFLGMENGSTSNVASQAYFLHGSAAPLWRKANKDGETPTVYYASNDTLPGASGYTEYNYVNEIYRYNDAIALAAITTQVGNWTIDGQTGAIAWTDTVA